MACARAQVQEKNECVASRMTFIGDVLAAPSCGYRTIRSAFHVRHASTSNMTCSVLLAAHPASASKVLQACSVLLAASNASHKPSPFKALTPAKHLAFPLAMSGLGKAHKDGKLIVNHQADCVPNGDLHCRLPMHQTSLQTKGDGCPAEGHPGSRSTSGSTHCSWAVG